MNKVVVVIVSSLTKARVTRIDSSHVIFLFSRFVRPQRHVELLRLHLLLSAAFSCEMSLYSAIVALRSFSLLRSLGFALSLSFLAPFRALEGYVEFHCVGVASVIIPFSPAIKIVSRPPLVRASMTFLYSSFVELIVDLNRGPLKVPKAPLIGSTTY